MLMTEWLYMEPGDLGELPAGWYRFDVEDDSPIGYVEGPRDPPPPPGFGDKLNRETERLVALGYEGCGVDHPRRYGPLCA
jgi:hypothetical protein